MSQVTIRGCYSKKGKDGYNRLSTNETDFKLEENGKLLMEKKGKGILTDAEVIQVGNEIFIELSELVDAEKCCWYECTDRPYTDGYCGFEMRKNRWEDMYKENSKSRVFEELQAYLGYEPSDDDTELYKIEIMDPPTGKEDRKLDFVICIGYYKNESGEEDKYKYFVFLASQIIESEKVTFSVHMCANVISEEDLYGEIFECCYYQNKEQGEIEKAQRSEGGISIEKIKEELLKKIEKSETVECIFDTSKVLEFNSWSEK